MHVELLSSDNVCVLDGIEVRREKVGNPEGGTKMVGNEGDIEWVGFSALAACF